MAEYYLTERHRNRWIYPISVQANASSNGLVILKRVYLQAVVIPYTVTAIGVNIITKTTSAGNVIAGIYKTVNDTEDVTGATLIVQSASTAVAAANTSQVVAFTSPTKLEAGVYYIGVEYDDNTHNYMPSVQQQFITGSFAYYDKLGAFGTWTNPCPAVTIPTGSVYMMLQVQF